MSRNGPFDLCITLDASDEKRLGEFAPYLKTAADSLCIDHHITNQGLARVNVIAGSASSTCEVLYGLLDQDKIGKAVAECLYTGIVHDTGVFKYSNTSRRTMEIAGYLMDQGIDFPKIIDGSFYQKSYGQTRVHGQAMLDSVLFEDGRCIYTVVTQEELKKNGCTVKSTDGIVDLLRSVTGVECAILLYETGNPSEYKVSLRTNTELDLSRIALAFGGGGHKKAAGLYHDRYSGGDHPPGGRTDPDPSGTKKKNRLGFKMYDGIINVYKEKGFTSFDVVAKMRGILGQKKVGHTGTLDPEAEGVLPVCVGKGTRLCDMLTDRDKTYEATLLLGMETDTQDTTGTVLSETDASGLTEEAVREAVLCFVGDYDQIPPMYSALKVNGRKLCDLARQGVEVERKPRPVKIYDITIRSIRLPEVVMTVSCSKGTYIRTLCHDIGERLAVGGCMKKLLRTRAAGFRMEDSRTLDELQALKDTGRLEEAVLPVETVFSGYKEIRSGDASMDRLLRNGNPFRFQMDGEAQS